MINKINLIIIIAIISYSQNLFSQQIIEKNNHYFTHGYKLLNDKNLSIQKNDIITDENYLIPTEKEDFIINSFNGKYGSNKSKAQIAIDSLGNYVITWIDLRNGYKQIFAQFYDNNDNRIGQEIIVSDAPMDWNNSPAIATNNKGDFIIAWAQNGYSIFAQRMDKFGKKIGNNFRLNSMNGYNISMPSIAVKNNGYFVAFWENKISTSNLYMRVFNELNKPINNSFGLNNDFRINDIEDKGSSSSGYGKRIAIDNDGNIGIVWSSFIDSKHQILFQALDSNYNKIGNNIIISDTNNTIEKTFPSVIGGKNGTFLIAWDGKGINARMYNIKTGFITKPLKIFESPYCCSWISLSSDKKSTFYIQSNNHLQKINSITGNLIGNLQNLSLDSTNSLKGNYSTISNCVNNKLYLLFSTYNNNDVHNHIHKYDSSLTFISDLGPLSNEKIGAWQTDPKVHTNNNGISLVIWKDMRNGNRELYAQIFNKNFNPIGNNFPINNSEDFNFYVDAKVASLSDGNFIVVYNGGNYNSKKRIFLTKINTDGNILKTTYIEDWNYDEYRLQLNVNSDDEILITFQSTSGYHAYLQRYNSNLEPFTEPIQFLKNKKNKFYSPLDISINNNFDILAIWNYYNFNKNTDSYIHDRKTIGLIFNKSGQIISDTLSIFTQTENNIFYNIKSKLDNHGNFIVLGKNKITRSYKNFTETITTQNDNFEYYTKFDIQYFKNKKAIFTVTNNHNVYLYFINDNQHTVEKTLLHKFIPFNTYHLKHYNNNSTSFVDNNLFFVYESNKHENTGYDIWGKVKHISFIDTSYETSLPFVNDDELFPVSPNPTNSIAQILFRIYSFYNVKISLYNILGEKVSVLYNKPTESGYYNLQLNTNKLSSGVYFIVMEAFKTKVRKFIVVK